MADVPIILFVRTATFFKWIILRKCEVWFLFNINNISFGAITR